MSYSRWQHTQSQSKWHFDNTKPPSIGEDSYTPIAQFSGAFAEACAQANAGLIANTWAAEHTRPWLIESNNLRSKITPDQADLIRAGADKDGEIYDRAPGDHIELFQQITHWLGMEMNIIKYHVQRTGQYVVTHIDNYAPPGVDNWHWLQRSCGITEFTDRTVQIRRFAIMLSDWQLGQVFQVGNAAWQQWRAGDCITWEWNDVPHATANLGWHPRPMLQITGAETDRTREIVAAAKKGKYQHVDFTLSS